ncbi:hypothetical protein [Campylobacter phage CJLB-10]|nr:hypothetical protein [Campylobacter phage CJLB-10]
MFQETIASMMNEKSAKYKMRMSWKTDNKEIIWN